MKKKKRKYSKIVCWSKWNLQWLLCLTEKKQLNYACCSSYKQMQICENDFPNIPSPQILNAHPQQNMQNTIHQMNDDNIVLENETHKILWDFDIQMDHLITARRPDLIIINNSKKKKKRKEKENMQNCWLYCPGWPQSKIKIKCEKNYNYLDLTTELKKLWNMKVTIIPIVIRALRTVIKRLIKGQEDLEIRGRV